MTRKRDLSIKSREKELIELVEDAERLKFDDLLIEEYKTQLKEIQNELKQDKEKIESYKNKKELENGNL